jgi:hypothetical protein
MSKVINDINWDEIMNKFSINKGTIIDFYKENKINPHQFYHQRKKRKKESGSTFYAKEFEVVYQVMKEKLLESHYVQADETTVTVVDSKGEDSKAKKYMWLYKTGDFKDPIILYDYQKTRSSSCPRDFQE